MKKVKIVLFLICSCSLLFSQDFILDNSRWHYTNPDGAGNPLVKCAIYEYTHDTVIDTKTCKVVGSNYYPDLYFYQEAGNIYYYKYDRFNLLYSFNVSIGDTIDLDVRCTGFTCDDEPQLYDSVFTIESYVTDIDSIFISDKYLSYVTVQFLTEDPIFSNSTIPSSFSYFERLGTQHDGFIPVLIKANRIGIDDERRLRCYADNEIDFISEWWSNYELDCDYTETTSYNQLKTKSVEVFPNPVENILHIKTDDSFIYNSYRLVDSKGSIQLQGSQRNIDFSQLKPGIYILEVVDTDNNTIFFNILKH